MPGKPVKKKKRKSSLAIKKRSKKVNRTDKRPSPRYLPEGALASRKAICVNVECKLRRAGCYGYEGCPGYKAKE